MLYRMEKLIGMSIGASDGELGKVKDLYFDDRRWAVRYLIVETGSWLEQRKVLISPIAVRSINWDDGIVRVGLTMEQVKASPDIDTDKPVSRQHELEFFNYYGYPDYFDGSMLWGISPYPLIPTQHALPGTSPAKRIAKPDDVHLRSAEVVKGYQLQATDESIGHLADFLLDDGSWAIRYVVVDTSNWWFGKHVVIPTEWITHLDWAEKNATVGVLREVVKAAPEYDPAVEFSREYEAKLFRHYERPAYWE